MVWWWEEEVMVEVVENLSGPSHGATPQPHLYCGCAPKGAIYVTYYKSDASWIFTPLLWGSW